MLENRTAAVKVPSRIRPLNVEPPSKQRAKRTNDPFAGLSKNSAQGRRIADLLRGFLYAMGDPEDAVIQANALRAAELTVAAETARAKLLAGEGDPDVVVRLEGMAARSVKVLDIKPPGEPPAVPFDQYLARGRTVSPADSFWWWSGQPPDSAQGQDPHRWPP